MSMVNKKAISVVSSIIELVLLSTLMFSLIGVNSFVEGSTYQIKIQKQMQVYVINVVEGLQNQLNTTGVLQTGVLDLDKRNDSRTFKITTSIKGSSAQGAYLVSIRTRMNNTNTISNVDVILVRGIAYGR